MKTIPFTAAHTYKAQTPPPPGIWPGKILKMYGWDLHSHRRFLLFPSPLFRPYFFSLSGFAPGRLAPISMYTSSLPLKQNLWESFSPIHSSDMSFFIEKTSRLHWTQRLEILTAWTARWRNVCFCTTWYCVPWQRQRAKFLSHLQVPVHVASSKITHHNSQGKMVSPILWKYIKCTFLLLGYIHSDFSSLAGRAQYFTLFSLCSVAYHHNLHSALCNCWNL